MKKITLIIALFTVCTFVHGQMNTTVTKVSRLTEKGYLVDKAASSLGASNVNKGISQSPTQKAAFYSEDFESVTAPAIPTGYITTTNGSDAGFYTGDFGDANVAGFWPVPDHSQFIMTNDDNCNCDKAADYLELPTFDFTGISNMSMRFAGYDDGLYGQNASTVELNINGGGWNVIYTFTDLPSWQNITVPLTGTDNMASVQIRFHYDDAGNWATGLAIDDIIIDLPPSSDLALVTDSNLTALDPWLTPIYTKIPVKQVGVTTFGARIENAGVSNQTNVVLNVDVNDGSNTVFAGTSPTVATMTPGSNSLFTMGGTFSPSNLGTYTMTFTASSDSVDGVPANNTTIKSYEVTDTVFSRDDDIPVFQLSAASFGAGGPYEFGNWFETVATDTATSISFVLGPNTVVGSVVQGKIYTPDGTTVLVSTPFYTIQASDIGVFPNFPTVTIMLDNPFLLTDTTNYLVSVADFSGTDSATLFITTGLLVANDAVPGYLFADGSWGGIAYYPFIRLNTKAPATICAMNVNTPSVTAVSCPAGNDGAVATIVPTGGTMPYSYLWDDPSNSTTDNLSGLLGGVYNCVISDANGCTYGVAVTIDEPDPTIVAMTVTGVTCFGGSDGAINVGTTGGTSPFSYIWSDTTLTGSSVSGLTQGTYSVTVNDANSCSAAISSTTVSEPADMVLTFTQVTASCGVGGSASVAVSGGVMPYVYAWNDPMSQSTAMASNLIAGEYICTVTDSNNCVTTVTDSVQGTPPVTASIAQNDASACGMTDGNATVTVVTGTSPYNYTWSDPGSQATAMATGLATGVYTVTVTDFILCSTVMTVTLVDSGAALLTSSLGHVNCFGGSDGVDTAVAFGTVPYTYSWNTSPVQTGAVATGLTAGSYTVMVIDGNGCSSSMTDSIGEPTSAVVIDSAVGVNISCAGLSDGMIGAGVSGGTSPYVSAWTSILGFTSTSLSISGLVADTYTLTTTDGNGCTVTSVTTITEPAAIVVTSIVTDVACKSGTTGGIDLTVTGGAGGYSYTWTGGTTNQDLTGVGSGSYSYTVTDANGCTSSNVQGISEPVSALGVTATVTDETVSGAKDGEITANVTGGTSPYTYAWSSTAGFSGTSNPISNLDPGSYTLNVTDANGCPATAWTDSVKAGTTGITEVINDVVFKIYPNPNTGQFIVELNNLNSNGGYQIEIRNIIGQTTFFENVSALNGNFYKQIDLTSSETGVYFISLINDEGKTTRKLIVY